MAEREHKTMKQAQLACRKLRQFTDAAAHQRAAEIEAQWRDDPEYESDLAYIMRIQAGPA